MNIFLDGKSTFTKRNIPKRIKLVVVGFYNTDYVNYEELYKNTSGIGIGSIITFQENNKIYERDRRLIQNGYGLKVLPSCKLIRAFYGVSNDSNL